MKDLKTFVCLTSKIECYSSCKDCSECDSKIDAWLDEHDKQIRANERAKAIDELENMICCEPWFTNKQKDVIRAMAKELKEKGDN